jgi:Cdc6-like AAA superfamily ATPase
MEGTGLWLLKDQKFTEWLDRRKKTLLFSGGPGVGKTVIVSSVIQHLQATFSAEPLVGTSYVYCDDRKAAQSLLTLLLSLSKQLYAGLDFTP